MVEDTVGGSSRMLRVQDRLSLHLGLPVDVANVNYLSPRQVHLSDVKLHHPETGHPVAWASKLELRQASGLWKLHIPEAHVEI